MTTEKCTHSCHGGRKLHHVKLGKKNGQIHGSTVPVPRASPLSPIKSPGRTSMSPDSPHEHQTNGKKLRETTLFWVAWRFGRAAPQVYLNSSKPTCWSVAGSSRPFLHLPTLSPRSPSPAPLHGILVPSISWDPIRCESSTRVSEGSGSLGKLPGRETRRLKAIMTCSKTSPSGLRGEKKSGSGSQRPNDQIENSTQVVNTSKRPENSIETAGMFVLPLQALRKPVNRATRNPSPQTTGGRVLSFSEARCDDCTHELQKWSTFGMGTPHCLPAIAAQLYEVSRSENPESPLRCTRIYATPMPNPFDKDSRQCLALSLKDSAP